MSSNKSVLFLSKNDEWSRKAYMFVNQHFSNVAWLTREWGESVEIKYIKERYDYIISYLCPCVLSQEILDLANEHAINFHPAPPKYPGIGGYNYAIWNDDEDYGVMVHEMAEKVDSGKIYNVVYFSIDKNQTVKELKEESMCMMFGLFQDTMMDIIDSGRIYQTVEEEDTKWHPTPYTRADFQKACELSLLFPSFTGEMIEKHNRAFYFPGARDFPYFMLNGKKYKVTPVEDD